MVRALGCPMTRDRFFQKGAVEKEGIDRGHDLRQQDRHVAKTQQQLDPPAVQIDGMQVGRQGRPGGLQFRHQRGKRRARVGAGKIVALEWVGLDRHEHQAPTAPRVTAPRIPGGQETVSPPEAGLEDGELLASGPASGELMSVKKDPLRRGGPIGRRCWARRQRVKTSCGRGGGGWKASARRRQPILPAR